MSCYVYWDKILQIAKDLEGYNHQIIMETPLEKLLPYLESIEKIAHDTTIDFDSAKHILENEKMNNALHVIRDFYLELSIKMETEKAIEIIESEDPWKTLESFYFFERYEKLISDEWSLAKFPKDEPLIFIGGGPIPLTLILFNKLFEIKGISIEIRKDMVELSKKVLYKLNLNYEIKVIHADETGITEYNSGNIIVAALAEPKKRVFRNIRDSITSKTKIIYRTYTGMRAILYSPVTEDSILGFKLIKVNLPTGKVNNTSVLIQKLKQL